MFKTRNMFCLLLAMCAWGISSEAKSKKVKSWQEGIASVTGQIQRVEQESAENLKKASDDLTAQLEGLQTRLNKEIESIAAQVQEVQENLNKFIEKSGSSS